MEFVDATILRLAESESRSAVFDEESLGQLLAASYDVDALGVEPPFSPVFDEFRLAYSDEGSAMLNGVWTKGPAPDATEVSLRLSGIVQQLSPRVDALWTGAIIAVARFDGDPIESVEVSWPPLDGLDDPSAPLPADPDELERQRRLKLITRIRSGLDQPSAFGEAALDRWLERVGARSVTALLASVPPAASGATMRLTFAPANTLTTRRSLPLAAALLVRGAPISLAALLDETRRVRPHLERIGFERPRGQRPRARVSPLIVWVLPAETFDDPGWPGAEDQSLPQQLRRARRRTRAGKWLAREGVGLLVPS